MDEGGDRWAAGGARTPAGTSGDPLPDDLDVAELEPGAALAPLGDGDGPAGASTIRLTIVSPNPVPPVADECPGSKTASRSASGIP